MKKRVKGFASISLACGINVVFETYNFVAKHSDFKISFIEEQSSTITILTFVFMAIGLISAGITSLTSGRIAAILAGAVNVALLLDFVMKWGLGESFAIASAFLILVYLIWGQDKRAWVCAAFYGAFAAVGIISQFVGLSFVSDNIELVNIASSLALVTAVSAVDG